MDTFAGPAYRPIDPFTPAGSAGYRPGACNIGPDEIAQRRRAGLVGALVTLGLLALLLAIGAPAPFRLLIALPAAGTAITYLQAILRFCVAFGIAGVFNFGRVGHVTAVEDRAAKRVDRARALRVILAGSAIGLAVGILAVLI